MKSLGLAAKWSLRSRSRYSARGTLTAGGDNPQGRDSPPSIATIRSQPWNRRHRRFRVRPWSSTMTSSMARSTAVPSWTARRNSPSAALPRDHRRALMPNYAAASRSRRPMPGSRPNTRRCRRRRATAASRGTSRARPTPAPRSCRPSSSSTRTAGSIRTSRTSRAGSPSPTSWRSRPTV